MTKFYKKKNILHFLKFKTFIADEKFSAKILWKFKNFNNNLLRKFLTG